MEEPKPSSTFYILMVVEVVHVFQVAIEGKEEFCESLLNQCPMAFQAFICCGSLGYEVAKGHLPAKSTSEPLLTASAAVLISFLRALYWMYDEAHSGTWFRGRLCPNFIIGAE